MRKEVERKIHAMNHEIGVDVVFHEIRVKDARGYALASALFILVVPIYIYLRISDASFKERLKKDSAIVSSAKKKLHELVITKKDVLDDKGELKSSFELENLVKDRKDKVSQVIASFEDANMSTPYHNGDSYLYGALRENYDTKMSQRWKVHEIEHHCEENRIIKRM